MHAFGAYPGLCPQWVSEVICHEKGDWRGEVCVSVPKRRGKGLSKKEKKKKLCWWAFKEWYPGPDNGTSIREWSSRGGYGDKDSYNIDTQEKLGGVSEMPCATRATCVAFLRDQVQVSGSVPDVSWGLDRHRGKKMRTRGADTWQRGKTSLSTSGMFSRPIKSHFWTHLSVSALINQNAISPTQRTLLKTTDMWKRNSSLCYNFVSFRMNFQFYVLTMQSLWSG